MNSLIEELLNEEESAILDFKLEQYPFTKATDNDKSELLKDILAFANAWRRTDAYILVGVKDKKGERSEPCGITSDFDDASIQQFVNSKTNRNIEFSYKTLTVDGVKIGMFHIPLQDRPFYLKKDYGKLKQNKVYIRRSSSTDEAEIDEIAKMGNVRFADSQNTNAPQNPTMEALKFELEQNNTILIESGLPHMRMRNQCQVIEVNQHYAVFKEINGAQRFAGAIKDITISYEPMMSMKLITISPVN